MEQNTGINTDNRMVKWAVPSMLRLFGGTMVITQAVEMVSSAVTSMFSAQLGAPALAAIAGSSLVTSVLSAVGVIPSIAACSVVSRRTGRGDAEGSARASAFFGWLSLVLGLICSLMIAANVQAITAFVGLPAESSALSVTYLRMLAVSAPLMLLQSTLMHILRAAGKPGKALMAVLLGLAARVVAMIAVTRMRLGMQGVGMAGCIGYAVTVMAELILIIRSPALSCSLKKAWPDTDMLVTLLLIGVPACAVSIAGIVQSALQTMQINVSSEVAASYAVANRVQSYALLLPMAVATGVMPMMGMLEGAGNNKRLREAVRMSAVCVLVMSVVISLVIGVFRDRLCDLFGAGRISLARDLIVMLLPGVLISSLTAVFISYFRGTGRWLPALVMAALACGPVQAMVDVLAAGMEQGVVKVLREELFSGVILMSAAVILYLAFRPARSDEQTA